MSILLIKDRRSDVNMSPNDKIECPFCGSMEPEDFELANDKSAAWCECCDAYIPLKEGKKKGISKTI